MRARLMRHERVALLYDGLSVHKTSSIQDALMREFGWLPMLNIAYQPNNNPIEAYFSVIKRAYRAHVTSVHV